jgi:hypothetical protein
MGQIDIGQVFMGLERHIGHRVRLNDRTEFLPAADKLIEGTRDYALVEGRGACLRNGITEFKPAAAVKEGLEFRLIRRSADAARRQEQAAKAGQENTSYPEIMRGH